MVKSCSFCSLSPLRRFIDIVSSGFYKKMVLPLLHQASNDSRFLWVVGYVFIAYSFIKTTIILLCDYGFLTVSRVSQIVLIRAARFQDCMDHPGSFIGKCDGSFLRAFGLVEFE
jgi:hypothetical protein